MNQSLKIYWYLYYLTCNVHFLLFWPVLIWKSTFCVYFFEWKIFKTLIKLSKSFSTDMKKLQKRNSDWLWHAGIAGVGGTKKYSCLIMHILRGGWIGAIMARLPNNICMPWNCEECLLDTVYCHHLGNFI